MSTLYDTMADLYDTLSVEGLGKNYAAEADYVATLARVGNPGCSSLLDVACGTGLHLEQFSGRLGFECAGVDASREMLEIARNRVPNVSLCQSDFVEFDLKREFDVVTCLYAAINHANTAERLRQAVSNMAQHLVPHGLLIVEPFRQPEAVNVGTWSNRVGRNREFQFIEVGRTWFEGDLLQYEAEYLIGTPEQIQHRTIQMTLGIFSWAQFREAFGAAGLVDVVVDETGIWEGKGLIIGRKPE